MYWLGVIALPIQLFACLRARRFVGGTSLTSAWRWSLLGVGVWSVTVVASYQTSGVLDHLAYAGVVCLIAPAIAVLGARRPGIGAWSGFVVLPLLVVLQWPSVSQAFTGSLHDAFELPIPVMLGCLLVTVMGLGNYFGTRFTLPTFLVGVALCLVLMSLVQPDSSRKLDVNRAVSIASVILALSALLFLTRLGGGAEGRSKEDDLERLNVVWNDFQELFGIVWAKRVMDRMNQFSQRESWPIRLELNGFEFTGSEPVNVPEVVIKRIRWVLRRFVDPDWLDARLHPGVTIEPDDA